MKKRLVILIISQELAKIVNRKKELLTAFDGQSPHPSATVDEDSYYPRIATG